MKKSIPRQYQPEWMEQQNLLGGGSLVGSYAGTTTADSTGFIINNTGTSTSNAYSLTSAINMK